MASLKQAVNCIGLSGQVSIRRDFYGYRTQVPATLSLLTQVRLLQGKHINLNLIRTASFNVSQQREIDFGLNLMRQIYATVNVGVGRIQRFFLPPGHEVIDGKSEAFDLWNEFSVSNDSIDVFLARLILGDVNGMSPDGGGSCDKDSKDDSGCVIDVEDSTDGLGLTLGQNIAHEVGHFLGLEHEDDLPDNLMFPHTPNGGRLYGGQGGVMVLHCSMNGGCRT
jgi:hypothetical protein